MKTITCQINGVPVTVPEGTTILKAALEADVKIPTLCAHPDLKAWGACGICIVRPEKSPRMVRSCTTTVVEGMNYITHDPDIVETRRTVLELIMSNHPNDCLRCARNGCCELQNICAEFGIREVPFESGIRDLPEDNSTPSVQLHPAKCISCGRCALVCQQLQDVWALEFLYRGDRTRIAPSGDATLAESPCIKCGQCSAHCPVGAITEVDETKKLWDAIREKDKHVVVQIAPAVRVALGEEFGLEPGTIITGKIYAALRRLGADKVFDTNLSADLTIMEEASEFVERFARGKGELPLITSCCPSWVDYLEKYHDDMIPNFSTAKSPMMMMGAMVKTYYAKKAGIDPEKVFSVAIMPCTAKKYEISRSEDMKSSGTLDVDLSITTRELARMIKQAGIDILRLKDEEADSPLGVYTGAGVIFGATGGVMEAALRTAYNFVTGENLGKVELEEVRGMDGVKTATIDIKGTKVRVAVAHGMANVKDIMNRVRKAKKEGAERPFDFIEVMACRGGCVAGGGQPYGSTDEVRAKRIKGIYADDGAQTIRCSHDNPAIKAIYSEFLGKPLSDKAHELLHTHYVPRPLWIK
ncbi:MAG TPA: NADH-dependent [FeFe] hydrogenase, group A6 [Treponemataceae bacterium]|nr:NADH-dependent [FeFe] hydrogenase, group A6 [Treponemataceae bacterium]HPS44919.1 NADH-dependent [FeFe] hydrogenase, group A6 [Treponemataceae bacterium]